MFTTSTTALVVKYILPADASTASPCTPASRGQNGNQCNYLVFILTFSLSFTPGDLTSEGVKRKIAIARRVHEKS